jgi:hypothetical protein
MLAPPSLVRDTVLVYSQDPALDAPPSDATDEERKRWQHRVDVARETGDWAPVLKPGQQPTRFVVRRIPGTTWRKIEDRIGFASIGAMEGMSLVLRAALKGVENFGDFKVTHADEDGIGSIAKADVIDLLDAVDPDIVAELGFQVLSRQRSTPGK